MLDGGFHTLERDSRRWVWSLNSEADDVEMTGLKQPVVGGRNWRSFSNSSSVRKTKMSQFFNLSAFRKEHIFEPYGDGDIYLRSAGTLQHLPVPLKTIIQLTVQVSGDEISHVCGQAQSGPAKKRVPHTKPISKLGAFRAGGHVISTGPDNEGWRTIIAHPHLQAKRAREAKLARLALNKQPRVKPHPISPANIKEEGKWRGWWGGIERGRSAPETETWDYGRSEVEKRAKEKKTPAAKKRKTEGKKRVGKKLVNMDWEEALRVMTPETSKGGTIKLPFNFMSPHLGRITLEDGSVRLRQFTDFPTLAPLFLWYEFGYEPSAEQAKKHALSQATIDSLTNGAAFIDKYKQNTAVAIDRRGYQLEDLPPALCQAKFCKEVVKSIFYKKSKPVHVEMIRLAHEFGMVPWAHLHHYTETTKVDQAIYGNPAGSFVHIDRLDPTMAKAKVMLNNCQPKTADQAWSTCQARRITITKLWFGYEAEDKEGNLDRYCEKAAQAAFARKVFEPLALTFRRQYNRAMENWRDITIVLDKLMPSWDKPDEEKTLDAETVKADQAIELLHLCRHFISTYSTWCLDLRRHPVSFREKTIAFVMDQIEGFIMDKRIILTSLQSQERGTTALMSSNMKFEMEDDERSALAMEWNFGASASNVEEIFTLMESPSLDGVAEKTVWAMEKALAGDLGVNEIATLMKDEVMTDIGLETDKPFPSFWSTVYPIKDQKEKKLGDLGEGEPCDLFGHQVKGIHSIVKGLHSATDSQLARAEHQCRFLCDLVGLGKTMTATGTFAYLHRLYKNTSTTPNLDKVRDAVAHGVLNYQGEYNPPAATHAVKILTTVWEEICDQKSREIQGEVSQDYFALAKSAVHRIAMLLKDKPAGSTL
ncbi:hypothetical protein BT69DRAFT_1333871 [Atractiella rhizophila]|nr:hypothetical protein BT69DRAFT_1333871 [Atractiella rhizophila]